MRDNSNDDKIILEPGYVLQNKLNVGSGLVQECESVTSQEQLFHKFGELL